MNFFPSCPCPEGRIVCGLRADDGSKFRIGRCPSGDGNRIASLDLDKHRSNGRSLVRSATRPLKRRNRPIQAFFSARRLQRTCGEKVRRCISGCAVAVAVKTGSEALQDLGHGQIARIAGAAGRRIVRPLKKCRHWPQCHADFLSGSTSGVFAGTMHDLHPASPHFAGPIAMRLRQTTI